MKNDWAVIVQHDLDDLEITETFEEIENFSKNAWKSKIKKIIKEKAFKFLMNQVIEKNMTEIKNNEYSELKIQDYFNCSASEVPKSIKKFTFKIRTRMVNVSEIF